MPIPPADYFAETPEERLIMYADKFHTKTTPPTFMTADTYAEFRKKFGQETVEQYRSYSENLGTPELESIALKYGLEIV